MWFHAALATAVITLAVTPACAAKITVSQYGRLVATLPWAVALQKNMFKEAGLDIDGITAGAGGGTSLRNMLAGELPYAELATSAAIAGSLAGVELKALASSSNHIGELSWAAKPDAGINSISDLRSPIPARGRSPTLLGTLIGELFASDQGLGFMLIRAMEAHKVFDIVALTLLLFAFAAIANGLLLVVERCVHRR
jgi:hypothetical protein